jgi:hypothetical protein
MAVARGIAGRGAYGVRLVEPLEPEWADVLATVARARGWPSAHDPEKLGKLVASLAAAYNDPSRARAAMRDAGAARLGFSFARDVPKGAAAVRELVAAGALRAETQGAPLRVLDVGAGLGAMTWGLLRALDAARAVDAAGALDARAVDAAGAPETRPPFARVHATWIDTDAEALETGMAIVRARQAHGSVELAVRKITRGIDRVDDLGPFDVVLLGNVLSELEVGAVDDAREASHAALLCRFLEERLAPHGALVVVEPALRDRTRHLHRVRDRITNAGHSVFAPCLHDAPCPALRRETDWCHEDLAVDLPAWLVPVSRVAGLRHEGLTFSYLVLCRDRGRLIDGIPKNPGAGRLRVVSDVIRSKGKREVFMCGEFENGPHEAHEGIVCDRVRVMRLDRDEHAVNDAFSTLHRGDVVVVDPAPAWARPRVSAANSVRGPVEANRERTYARDSESR